VGALCVLLPHTPAQHRTALFKEVLERFRDSLPSWHRGIFLADMLSALPAEAQVDLLLEIDAQVLAAWISLLDTQTRSQLMAGLPAALRSTIGASSAFSSRARQLFMADSARRDLARAFQRQLGRSRISFEAVVAGGSEQ
jgi:hypothetical protein